MGTLGGLVGINAWRLVSTWELGGGGGLAEWCNRCVKTGLHQHHGRKDEINSETWFVILPDTSRSPEIGTERPGGT